MSSFIASKAGTREWKIEKLVEKDQSGGFLLHSQRNKMNEIKRLFKINITSYTQII